MLERINEWDHSIREIPLGEFSSSAPRHRFALISWFFAVLVWIRFLFFSRHCAVTFAGADNQARFDDSHLDLAPGAIPRRVARIITKRILMAEFIGNPRKCVSQIIQCIGIVKPAAAAAGQVLEISFSPAVFIIGTGLRHITTTLWPLAKLEIDVLIEGNRPLWSTSSGIGWGSARVWIAPRQWKGERHSLCLASLWIVEFGIVPNGIDEDVRLFDEFDCTASR